MFGHAETKTAEDRAALRRIYELAPAVNGALSEIKKQAESGRTDRCEASASSLKEAIKKARLPNAFTDETTEAVDFLIMHAFMKAASEASMAAIEAGFEDEIERRAMKIKEARKNLAGAMKYKAPKSFQRKCERLLETALYSGGIKAKGPTAAKPFDDAPKPANRAKPASVV